MVREDNKWRARRDPLRRRAPARLRPWLEDSASMTARIQAFCGGRLRVRVLAERWARPTLDEARTLRLETGRLVWVREVLLMADDVPWVYARTAIPPATLTGAGRGLLRLGARPLGSVLFDRLPVRREPLRIRRLGGGDPLLAAVQARLEVPAGLWARRSMLRFSGRRLLVTEVFLPALLERLEHD